MENLKLRLDMSKLENDEEEEEEEYLKLTKKFSQQPYSKATMQKKQDVVRYLYQQEQTVPFK